MIGKDACNKFLPRRMNINDVTISRYNWEVVIITYCGYNDIEAIINELNKINCPDIYIQHVIDMMKHKDINVGFTYSNTIMNKSIVCISNVSSTGELVNTTVHELFHLISHISIANNFNDDEEQCAYLIGDIARIVFMSVLNIFN